MDGRRLVELNRTVADGAVDSIIIRDKYVLGEWERGLFADALNNHADMLAQGGEEDRATASEVRKYADLFGVRPVSVVVDSGIE